MQIPTGKFFRETELPRQKSFNGVLFPAVLSPTTNTNITAFKEAIRAKKPWLESLLKRSGVILFRGFPVSSPSDFNDVVEAFGFLEAQYVGGRAPRTKVAPDFPSKLFFFCEEEPGKGGETPVVLSNIIYEKMKEKKPELVVKLEEHGVKYTTIAGDEDHPSDIAGRGWKSIYMTDDKQVAEESNLTGPVNGDNKIFDQATCVELGNGEVVPNDAMEDCLRFLEEECVAIPWKKGDVYAC
ncbi:hypothetical protein L1987_20841 [Smallanthus sonchifolius]|uniref:Uncharacterized protein n=1 Tax=Smallanthus sonchifolius TaxID=185202 RepID=A0ACB9ISY0_9ASTR|nr:hypothetical protein L1987_20841 [Smallanthus sonchifolius]